MWPRINFKQKLQNKRNMFARIGFHLIQKPQNKYVPSNNMWSKIVNCRQPHDSTSKNGDPGQFYWFSIMHPNRTEHKGGKFCEVAQTYNPTHDFD